MRKLLAGMIAVTALVLAAPAQAAPTSFWFNCTGPLPLQTINVSSYSWSATAPATSYQAGAGCGYLDPPAKGTNQPNPFYDAGYGGSYGGEVRKLELTLYAPFNDTLTDKGIDLIIRADGTEVVNVDNARPSMGTPSSASVAPFTYTITGLDLPAKATRDYVIAVAANYTDDTPGWLHGAKEVPSNVKFFAFEDLTPEEQAEILGEEQE